jgi:hypothetical protein
MQIQGAVSDYTGCESDWPSGQNIKREFWYVFSHGQVFIRCSQTDATSLIEELSNSASDPSEGPDVEYLLPLRDGQAWGRDSDRDDTKYEWFVTSEEKVKVPAGPFDACYRIVYQTLPDTTARWICPGVGLVAYEYTHHGTIMHERVELIKTPTGN